MIRLPSTQTLPAETGFALSLLVDRARLVPADAGDVVELRVAAESSTADRLDAARQVIVGDGTVTIGEAALRLVSRISGAVDEQRSPHSDRFGRVPPSDNFLAARSLERDPVVDRFAITLRTAVVEAAGPRRVALVAPWPEGRRWAMAMTHDLDVVALWPVFTAMRLMELARKGRARDVVATLTSAVSGLTGDPVWNAARRVLDVERTHGVRSTWFIITGTPTLATMRAGDVTYAPESAAARRILDAIRDAGHELGLHGSFETWTDAERFRGQRERLEQIAARPVSGVRQHFLRMRPGDTHEAMRAAGFRYDSTYGFADRNGFRLGTAQPSPAWSAALGRSLSIDTVPFIWMDRALSKYRGVEDPGAWIDDAIALAGVCREVEGVWTGIWHPNLSGPLGFPGAEQAFDDLCSRLMAEAPWTATLGDIVEWRAARRAVRAIGFSSAGELRLTSDTPGAWAPRVAIEDAAGRSTASRWD
jgi:hypothetical protein